MFVLGTPDDEAVFATLVHLNQEQGLGLDLLWQVWQVDQRSLMDFAHRMDMFIAIIKGVPMLVRYDGELMKLAPNWQALTRRIISAGRKSELLLQACKLSAGMRVIDATAGFGHDGLILASTGAVLTLVEQNPVMSLLLFYEYGVMSQHKNWQKLLQRIDIVHAEATVWLPSCQNVDLVYLDPMFPHDSYHCKVGKYMQILHSLVKPPTPAQETELLNTARAVLSEQGKVVVKRPMTANFLAGVKPVQSYANDAVRFDVYQ